MTISNILKTKGLDKYTPQKNFLGSQQQVNAYYRLLSLFMDNVTDSQYSPFGIHSIARVGLSYKRKPGDWYGPQAISNVLHDLNKQYKPVDNFKMLVCYDGNVFLDKIGKKISKGNSVFVIIPVRIGLE